MGCSFFRKLVSSINSGNVVDQLLETNEGKMTTRVVSKRTVPTPEQRIVNQDSDDAVSEQSSGNETELSCNEGGAPALDKDPTLC